LDAMFYELIQKVRILKLFEIDQDYYI
jgi:hypothetical protein